MKNEFSLLIASVTLLFFVSPILGEEPETLEIGEIRIQMLNMELPPNSKTYSEVLLPGEITDIEVIHSILSGPHSHTESLSDKCDNIFLFIKGNGSIHTDEQIYIINSESIAVPTPFKSIEIHVNDGDTLHYLNIRKIRSQQDTEDLQTFPLENRNKMYFTSFNDCKAYTEKIKSVNTVSRTVLPKEYVPRVAMGTVEAKGPDQVGAHEHPMLDQLFLGLSGNDVIVQADDKSIQFPEFSLLHIPIGSSHGVRVDEGKYMYYQWMDFFLNKEGEALA